MADFPTDPYLWSDRPISDEVAVLVEWHGPNPVLALAPWREPLRPRTEPNPPADDAHHTR